MFLANQIIVSEYIANFVKLNIADGKRSKDYAHHVQKIQNMIDSGEGSKIFC